MFFLILIIICSGLTMLVSSETDPDKVSAKEFELCVVAAACGIALVWFSIIPLWCVWVYLIALCVIVYRIYRLALKR
jgi:hypothetical protein